MNLKVHNYDTQRAALEFRVPELKDVIYIEVEKTKMR
jgi:hypothetical protein